MSKGTQMFCQKSKKLRFLIVLKSWQGSFILIRQQRLGEFVPQSHTVAGRILLILLLSIMERLYEEK